MGRTVRDKHVRPNRRLKPPTAAATRPIPDDASIPKHLPIESSSNPINPFPTPNPNPNPNDDVSSGSGAAWGYCTEDELQELIIRNLDALHNEAVSKLVAMGYNYDQALAAVLRNGHRYGETDVVTDVVRHSLAYLGGEKAEQPENYYDYGEPVFDSLRQLQEHTVETMVLFLRHFRPALSKGDALWCLLMSDLNVSRASAMEIPIPTITSAEGSGGDVIVEPELCRFHGGWGFGNGGGFAYNGGAEAAELALQRDVVCPDRFNLSPSMKSVLKRNVARVAIVTARFRANAKQQLEEMRLQKHQQQEKSQEVVVNSVTSEFSELNIDEGFREIEGDEDQKDEMIVGLLQRVKELEKQVKERKEWAHQKAMQAATKLSHDLTELKLLRTEREEIQRLKKGKQTLEDSTMKRLLEMENALRKASGQVDRANAAVRRLENENAEIRAEMEACKLSASESVNACLEVAKREKKCLKKLLAWEKQKAKLQDEIDEEKKKILELQQELGGIKQDQNEAEMEWKQEVKAKEAALTLVEEERAAKETAEASNKRKLKALRLKIEIDFQRRKDDLQRVEQELSRLKSSAQSTELPFASNALPRGISGGANPQGETIAKMLRELENLENSAENEVSCDRECMTCMKDEVCVVFLPCAHQVLCANCNDDHDKKGRATCPYCRAPIEQRIRVFGASS